jgi:hypothetical protein
MTVMQQTPQSAPPTTATPPTLPPGATFTLIGPQGQADALVIPRTREQVRALLTRREALSDQLTSVSERRHELSMELQGTADGAARSGLQDRIRLLDQRLLQLETDLATTGRELSAAAPEMVATTEVGMSQSGGGHFEEGMAVGGVSVLLACATLYFFARRRWKRSLRAVPAGTSADSGRLERLEHGMEAIAIEIERVSEGQRFVTRLLSESQPPRSAAGDGEPVAADRIKPIPDRAR